MKFKPIHVKAMLPLIREISTGKHNRWHWGIVNDKETKKALKDLQAAGLLVISEDKFKMAPNTMYDLQDGFKEAFFKAIAELVEPPVKKNPELSKEIMKMAKPQLRDKIAELQGRVKFEETRFKEMENCVTRLTDEVCMLSKSERLAISEFDSLTEAKDRAWRLFETQRENLLKAEEEISKFEQRMGQLTLKLTGI